MELYVRLSLCHHLRLSLPLNVKLAMKTIFISVIGMFHFLICYVFPTIFPYITYIQTKYRLVFFTYFSRKPSSLSNTNQVNYNNNQKAKSNNQPKSHSALSGEKTYFGMNPGRVNACMIKTFNRMKKRIGFLIYQFVLPAIQVTQNCTS